MPPPTALSLGRHWGQSGEVCVWPDSQRPSRLCAFLLPPAHPSPLGLSDEGGGAWNTWPGRLGGRAHLLFEHDSRGRLQVGAGDLSSVSGCSGVGGSHGESLMLSGHLPSPCSLCTTLPGRALQGLCTHKALSRTPPPLGGLGKPRSSQPLLPLAPVPVPFIQADLYTDRSCARLPPL